MGSLLRFPLSPEFVKRFPIFIETGYGEGRSLSYAATHDFTQLYSIELWDEAARKGRAKFSDNLKVNIIHGYSAIELGFVIDKTQKMMVQGKRFDFPVFFWLDAHFPGSDYYSEPFDKYPEYVRLPLEKELEIIRDLLPMGNYFILIDDLRFYADYDWGDGIIPEHLRGALPSKRSLDFLDPFHSTHCVSIDLHDSGYALIGPHDAPFLEFKE
jgi:hypothetical protein